MSGAEPHPDLEELGAYLDGELDEKHRATIAAHLAVCPMDRERVAAYRRCDAALRIGVKALVAERAPVRLASILHAHRGRRRRRAAIAAGVLALLVGGGAAWWAVGPAGEPTADLVQMVQDADAAYRVYPLTSPEKEGTLDPATLSARLSQQLGTAVRVPILERWGFRLSRDQLLVTRYGLAAQLTYVDAGGRRLTCLFRRRPVSGDVEPRFREEDGVVTAYGAEGELGYVMTSSLPRHELHPIAEAVYRAQES
ncbi:anti-sigma factor family protein [Benzoatithermus flavus]|uniref:Zf-HC2 domain-containing protein n=1 Tax=Benzoatithermus flavus TaxID=3108223 RepID=A0ABU8XQH5_9PROT